MILTVLLPILFAVVHGQTEIPRITATPTTDLNGESSIVIATASDASRLSTVTAVPTPEHEVATISTVTAAQGTLHSGDVLISLPSPTAAMLEQVFAESDESQQCVDVQLRKRQGSGPSVATVRGLTMNAIRIIMNEGKRSGFGFLQAANHLAKLANAESQAAVDQIVEAIKSVEEFAGLPIEDIRNMVAGIWSFAFGWCEQDLEDLYEIVLQDTWFAEDNPGGEENNDNEECPANAPKGRDAPACDDPRCSGKDRVCQADEWKGCECLSTAKVIVHEGTLEEWRANELGLQALLSPTDFGWSCHEKQMTLEANDFQILVDAFCIDVNLESTIKKDMTAKGVGFTGYDDTVFTFSWTNRDSSCSGYCSDIYSAFLNSNECGSDSHHRSLTGLQDFACGVATYSFNQQEPGPPAPYEEGTCHLELGLQHYCDGIGNGGSPFWIKLNNMTDNRGGSLQPTWSGAAGQCEAAYPCHTDSLLEDRLFMRPILGELLYIQFDLANNEDEGHLAWRSDDRMEDGKFPRCEVTTTRDETLSGCHLAAYDVSCDFPCDYRGGPTSKDEPES